MKENEEELFEFELISPEKKFLSVKAKMVCAPGASGELGILKNHTALLSSLVPGVVRTFNTTERGLTPSSEIFISGGFCEVQGGKLTVLAEDAVYLSELKVGDLEREVKEIKGDIEHIEVGVEKRRAKQRLFIATEKLEAVRKAAA